MVFKVMVSINHLYQCIYEEVFSFNILDTKDMEESASKKGRECLSPWPTP